MLLQCILLLAPQYVGYTNLDFLKHEETGYRRYGSLIKSNNSICKTFEFSVAPDIIFTDKDLKTGLNKMLFQRTASNNETRARNFCNCISGLPFHVMNCDFQG